MIGDPHTGSHNSKGAGTLGEFLLRAEHALSYLQLLGLGEQFERQLIDRCLGAFVTHFERCLYFKYLVCILQLCGKEEGLKRP